MHEAAPLSTFDLPPALAVDTAGDLKPWLAELLRDAPEHAAICLNAAFVSRLTTPGLQLLCAFEAALLADGKRLRVADASKAFADSCTQLGFTDHFQRWSA